jgi:hypothetical protein
MRSWDGTPAKILEVERRGWKQMRGKKRESKGRDRDKEK